MESSQKKWLAVGLIGAFVIVGVIGIGVYTLWQFGKDELNPPVDAYLNTLQSQNYAGLYGQVSNEWRNYESQEEFTEFHRMIHNKLGNHYSRSLKTFNIQHNTGHSYATATYDVEFTKGDAELTFEFSRSGSNWQIQSVNYESPVFVN